MYYSWILTTVFHTPLFWSTPFLLMLFLQKVFERNFLVCIVKVFPVQKIISYLEHLRVSKVLSVWCMFACTVNHLTILYTRLCMYVLHWNHSIQILLNSALLMWTNLEKCDGWEQRMYANYSNDLKFKLILYSKNEHSLYVS